MRARALTCHAHFRLAPPSRQPLTIRLATLLRQGECVEHRQATFIFQVGFDAVAA